MSHLMPRKTFGGPMSCSLHFLVRDCIHVTAGVVHSIMDSPYYASQLCGGSVRF